MSFPPTTATFPPTAFHPEPLLALACPTCFGAIAVGSDLLGQAAECPLCQCGFRVPLTSVADTTPQPAVAASATSPATEPPARPRQQHREPRPHAPPPKTAAPPSKENAFDEPPPQAAPVKELQFQEPVRTVGSGAQVVELRRLTPEEKAVRRARRNLIMMLTGVSILMAIVFSLGTKRSKRRE
jgi:hypothetical protein